MQQRQVRKKGDRVESSTSKQDGDPSNAAFHERGTRQPKTNSSRFTLDRIVRFMLGAGVLALTVWVIWFFSDLLFYLVVGAVIAYLLRPFVDTLQGVGFGRILSIMIVFLFFFGGIGLFLTYFLPYAAEQVTDISQTFSFERVKMVVADLEARLREVLPLREGVLVEGAQEGFQTLFRDEQITETASYMVGLFTDIFYALIIIPFIVFFFLKDGTHIRYALFRLVPNRYFELTLALVAKIESSLGRYFRALLVQCVSVATVASVLLYFVGLKYSVPVGLFTGLANTIPYFGPSIGFIAGTLVGVAQTGNFDLIPGVLVAMALTQIADNLLFQPLIFSRAAGTHPLIILIVVLIGAQLAGIVGMLVAIPLTTAVRVAIEQVLWSLRNYRILKAH